MAQIFDISQWGEQPWLSTGGTRNKKIYLNPADNQLYYFKQSLKKEGKDYKYEFWSEIMAYEIGKLCGFNVLPYHIAIRENEVGCISQSMIDPDKEELVEGGRYIQAFDTAFNPEDRTLRHQYTFELIISSLSSLNLQKYYPYFIEVLVFDALIGNSDRHQENWAFINSHSMLSKQFAELEQYIKQENVFVSVPKIVRNFLKKMYTEKGELKQEYKKIKLSIPNDIRFSPIYDNGCSFGRELIDARVQELLNDETKLDSYTKKGLSEIHWDNKKVSHFILLENLLKDQDFEEMVKTPIKKMVESFNAEQVTELINNIDVDLPTACQYIKIPSERKQLICKLVISRFNTLKGLI